MKVQPKLLRNWKIYHVSKTMSQVFNFFYDKSLKDMKEKNKIIVVR